MARWGYNKGGGGGGGAGVGEWKDGGGGLEKGERGVRVRLCWRGGR